MVYGLIYYNFSTLDHPPPISFLIAIFFNLVLICLILSFLYNKNFTLNRLIGVIKSPSFVLYQFLYPYGAFYFIFIEVKKIFININMHKCNVLFYGLPSFLLH